MYDTSGFTFAVGCYRGTTPAKGQVSAIWFTVLHSFAKLTSKTYSFKALLFHLTEHKYIFKPCKTASYSKKEKKYLALTWFCIGWFSSPTGYNKDYIVSVGINENAPAVGVDDL